METDTSDYSTSDRAIRIRLERKSHSSPFIGQYHNHYGSAVYLAQLYRHIVIEGIYPYRGTYWPSGSYKEKYFLAQIYLAAMEKNWGTCSSISLVPRPPHSFCRLQYEKRGNEATLPWLKDKESLGSRLGVNGLGLLAPRVAHGGWRNNYLNYNTCR